MVTPSTTAASTVIWNLSKRADNASGLVQPETFDMLFHLLCQDEEEGDVLRRVVSCVQNLASMRACASDLTDYIASDPSVSNVLGTLFGLLAGGGAKNMHQRVLGTFANLAYLCVGGDSSEEWAGHLRYTTLCVETMCISVAAGSFSLFLRLPSYCFRCRWLWKWWCRCAVQRPT